MHTREEQNTPLVSVIMPAYNVEQFLAEAIQSVLEQTLNCWELIVIDDCSSDATYEIADSFGERDSRIRVLKNEHNMGVAQTRNRGLGLCRGQYVAFLDSDDAWRPDKLERQIEKMRQTNASLCYCSYAIVDAAGEKAKSDYIVPEQVDYTYLLRENVIQCSAIVITAQLAREFCFQDSCYHEDYVLCLDILKAGYTAAGCVAVLHNYRYLEDSRSSNKWRCAKYRWIIYRKYLKLPLFESVCVFVHYVAAGLRKYR